MLIKVAGVGLSILVTIVLARSLGPDDFGLYSLLISFITLVAIPMQSGVATLLVREIARYGVTGKWELIKGLIVRANQAAVIYAVIAGGLLSAAVFSWASPQSDGASLSLCAFFLFLLLSLGYVRGGAVRGLRYVAISQVPEVILRPAVTIGSVLTFVALSPDASLTLSGAVLATTIAAFAAFVYGAVILHRSLPPQVRASRCAYENTLWAKSVIPLSIVAGVQVLDSSADIIMLGVLRSASEVGIYRVSLQAAAVVSFGLIALNIAVAPFVSSLHASGDTDRLQHMLNTSTAVALLYSVVAFIILTVVGPLIIPAVFSSEYSDAYLPMLILAFGYMMLVANGAVLTVATMLGFERDAVHALLVGITANIALNAILIPVLGKIGAAIATTVGTLVWRMILVRKLQQHTGVKTSVDPRALIKQLRLLVAGCN